MDGSGSVTIQRLRARLTSPRLTLLSNSLQALGNRNAEAVARHREIPRPLPATPTRGCSSIKSMRRRSASRWTIVSAFKSRTYCGWSVELQRRPQDDIISSRKTQIGIDRCKGAPARPNHYRQWRAESVVQSRPPYRSHRRQHEYPGTLGISSASERRQSMVRSVTL